MFRTEYDVVIMQGEAILGLEAAAASLISPGDKVLNLVSGVFGKWFEDFIRQFGGETIELAVPYNDAIDPEDVRRALACQPGRQVPLGRPLRDAVRHAQPGQGIGNIAHEFGVLTMVDTVSGLGARVAQPGRVGPGYRHRRTAEMPGRDARSLTDDDQPRGLAGDGSAIRIRCAASFLSILDWKDALAGKQSLSLHSVGQRDVRLESTLTQTLEIGMERFVDRHQTIAHACREGAKALGLELWPVREEISATCVTAREKPEGLDEASSATRCGTTMAS